MNLNLIKAVGALTGAVSFALGSAPLYTDVNYTDQNTFSPRGIEFSDVDRDGTLDMVTADQDTGVGIRFGNGDGTFGSQTIYSMDPGTPGSEFIVESLEVGDLNGDGDPDVAVAGYGFLEECDPFKDPDCEFRGPSGIVDTGVHFRLNNGDGTFGPVSSLFGVLEPTALTIADLDGDTDLDIFAIEVLNSSGYYWLNNGSASFGPRQQVFIDTLSTDVDSGDFDNDGDMDIAVIRLVDDVLDVLLNNGNATFAAPVSYPITATNPRGLDLADVDDDGDLDAAVAAQIGDQLTIFYNNGSGAFPTSQDLPTGNSPGGTRFADIDNDGDPDVLSASSDDRYVNYHLNDGTGTFGPREFINTGGAEHLAVADLNDDGLIDLGMANIRFGSGFTVRLNTPNGLDGERQDYSATLNPRSIAFLDFNNDNKIDIATAGGNTGIAVRINAGDGTFPTQVFSATGSVPRVAAADLNNDTFPDLAYSNFSTDDMTVLLNDTVGGLAAPVTYPVGDGPQFPVLADVDGDTDPDFIATAATNANGNIVVLLNNGSGVFGAPTSYPLNGSPRGSAVADVNGDTAPDIVVPQLTASVVSVLINNGSGLFAAPVDYPTATRPDTIELGDIDGDGDPDIVAGSGFSFAITTYLNDGTGVFGSRVDTSVDTDADDIELADLDDDGDLDLIADNPAVAGFTIHLNDGTGTFTPERDHLVGRLPNVLETSDINEDGVMDIVVAQSSGFLSVHLGSNPGAACPADLAPPEGILNFFDLGEFLTRFNAQDPSVDFAAPFGVFNFFDLGEFLTLFNQGCP